MTTLLLTSILVASCATGSEEDLIPTRAPAPTFTPTTEGQAAIPQPATAAPELDQQPVAEDGAGDADAPAAEGETPAEAGSDTEPVTIETGEEASTDPTAATEAEPAAAQPEAIVSIQLLNVRSGPGVNYNILGGINQGERYPITGRNELGDWWEINYNGQSGWLFNELVTVENAGNVAVAANIPTPPPATPTSPPPPTAVPVPTDTPAPIVEAPAEEAPAPAPAADANLPFQLLDTVTCTPNAGTTYFSGFVRYNNNSLRNAVCVHLHFYEPRTTKCSGCDGVGDGIWGFSPFGGPAPSGTPIEIWVVECPDSLPLGGQNSGFGDLTPLSPKWTHTIGESEQCTGITFVGG